MSTSATTSLWKSSGGWETLHKGLDPFTHCLGDFRVALQVFDGFLQTTVDAILIVEEVGREFFKALKIFFKDLLTYLCIQARRGGFQFFKIEFGFSLGILHSMIVLPSECGR